MSVLVPNAKPPQRIIDPVAFFVALIGAPIVFALFTFWAYFIPVAAIVFGGPVYLVVGTPLLLWMLSKGDPNYGKVILWSLTGLLAALAALPLISLVIVKLHLAEAIYFFGGFGLFFAPAWAATFLALYRLLRREFYASARPFS